MNRASPARPAAGAARAEGAASPDGRFDLEGYLRVERGRVRDALERTIARWDGRIPPPLAAAAAHGLRGGGKRLRPVLCVTAFRACGGSPRDAAYDLAGSFEIVHAYSLMHDDLPCMDDAELRRGRPATHRLHGSRSTIAAGALMIPLAALQALEACAALGVEAAAARTVVLELLGAAGAGGMVGGQVLDLLGEGAALGTGELDVLHGLKTGALLTGALRVGALAAGVRAETLSAVDAYGRAVGLAFQIADDLLDATATAETLGKHPSDSDLRKSTYVSLHGPAEARRRAFAKVRSAREALDRVGLGADEPSAAALHALAEFAVSRGH